MSQANNQQYTNPIMQQYASGVDAFRLTLLFILTAIVHYFDHHYFGLQYSTTRVAVYIMITLLVLFGINTDNRQRMHTIITLFLIWGLFFLFVSLLLNALPFELNVFSWGDWIVRVLFVIVPFVIISIFMKKFTGERFQPDYPILMLFFYTAFALPFIAEFLQTNQLLQTFGGSLIGFGLQTPLEFFIVVIPAWFWYLNTITVSLTSSSFAKLFPSLMRFIQFIAILILTISIIASNYVAIESDNVGGYVGSPFTVAKEFFLSGYDAAVMVISERTELFQNQTRRALDFEGEVEQGAQVNVGLTLERLQQSQQRFVQGQEIAFFTTLQARSFGTNIPVRIGCIANDAAKKSEFTGIVNRPEFQARDFVNTDVTCRFAFLPKNQYTVDVTANFDYIGSAYLRRYFTREGLLGQFQNQGASPTDALFAQYQITDRDPRSVYTRGPVSLHLSTPNIVEELLQSGGDRTKFRLQLGIKNEPQWGGRIYAINNVLLSIPIGFQLATGGTTQTGGLFCTTGGFESNITLLSQSECQSMREPFSDLDCENYYHYKITPVSKSAAESVQVPFEQIRAQELVMSCDIEALTPNEILSGSAFSIDTFRARVAYSYEMQQKLTFRVNEPNSDDLIVPDIESLSRLEYCDIPNAYHIEPNYGLVFAFNPSLNETFSQRRDAVLSPSSHLSNSDREHLEGSNCFERHLFWGITYQFWDQVRYSINVGQTYYGYMRATPAMYERVKDSQAEIPDNLTKEEISKYLEENNLFVAFTYLDAMRQRCVEDSQNQLLEIDGVSGDNDVVCAIGKYICGPNFEYGNYNSCTTHDCNTCHRVLIPNILTIATQSEHYNKGSLT